MKLRTTDYIAVLLLFAWIGANWETTVGPVIEPTPKVDAVTYVTRDRSKVPAVVGAALDKLNRQQIVATVFVDGTTDGTGETPEQYKIPQAESDRLGMPALVVMGGGELIRTIVGEPKTVEEVLEAAR